MGILCKGLLNVLHVGAATCQDDTTQQLIIVFGRNLIAYVLYNLLDTSLNNLDKTASFHLTLGIDRVFHIGIDIIIVGIGRSILQLHLLGIAVLHLERSNVLGDVVRA